MNYQKLKKAEKSVYSQGGQDGVLEEIFTGLGVKRGFYIEFGGAMADHISNTANLRINHKWKGLLMDSEPLDSVIKKEYITAENINSIFKKYKVPAEVDYLSVDLDGIDFYVWQSIKLKPKVVSIEYNSKFENNESYAIKYNPKHKWEDDDYYSASLLALKKLGEQKGYTLVYVVAQLDAIFVRNNLLKSDYEPPTLDELLPYPIIAHEKVSNKKWIKF